jgi:serine/threonine-protein kinase SRPK3
MVEKYLFNEAESAALCEFLEPMLAVNFRERVNARDMKDHKWFEVSPEDGIITEW